MEDFFFLHGAHNETADLFSARFSPNAYIAKGVNAQLTFH